MPFVITLIFSAVTTYYLFKWLDGYSVAPMVENSFSKGQVIKLFATWLIYFFALMTLPFFMTNLIKWSRLNEKDWWKAIIVLELFSLVFSYVTTPPDIISTILFFLICQPIVIINSIVLRRKLTEFHNNNLSDG